MKKHYLKMIGSLLFTTLVVISCKKETTIDNYLHWHCDKCQLTSITSETGDQIYHYNQRGLVDDWYVFPDYEGHYKLQYNARGRLIKARFYAGNTIIATILFIYENNRVKKEIWYDGDTQLKTDEVFYHYTSGGLIRKSESFMKDYYTEYKHTPDGNVESWIFYVAGMPAYASSYTYLPPHYKNPFLARPGLDYDFPFVYGGVQQNKWYPTGEKDFYYNELGKPVIYVDIDPTKTIVKANANNYVTASDFFDKLTGEFIHFRFKYENCGSEDDGAGFDQQQSFTKNRRINPLNLLQRASSKSIKEQVAQLRLLLSK